VRFAHPGSGWTEKRWSSASFAITVADLLGVPEEGWKRLPIVLG
jgi:hypothetical protein